MPVDPAIHRRFEPFIRSRLAHAPVLVWVPGGGFAGGGIDTAEGHVVSDALTGLANRANRVGVIDHAQARRARRNGSVALIYVDLDDSKAVKVASACCRPLPARSGASP